MAYSKSPAYLWQHASGQWYFKRPIPPELQNHFADPLTGKKQTHIVRGLGTHNRAQAEKLKRPHASEAEALFRRYASAKPQAVATATTKRLAEIRAAMAEVADEEGKEDAVLALEDMAQDAAEQLEREQGAEAADLAYRTAVDPSKKTLKEALEAWLPTCGLTQQTQQEHRRTLDELLAFLKVSDALPESIGDKQAVAYVEMLNEGPLSHATKKGRLSSLGAFWAHLGRKRAVQRHRVKLWQGHDITGGQGRSTKAKDPGKGEDGRRNLTDAEIVLLFEAPDIEDGRKRAYGRPLFRELYALGLLTGMRLNEIVSLTAADVGDLKGGGLVVEVRKGKTEAAARAVPVTHPVAVGVLKARKKAQKDPQGRLFSECAPGGPDSKPSWHVSKALGRDRDRLGLPPGADFHSTRGNFATMMENSGTNSDHVKRYFGHVIDDVLRKSYSAGMSAESLRHVAEAVRYSEGVEGAMRAAIASR